MAISNRTVTLKDIARAVGVSHATVSRVLNNVPGRSASPRTREKVVAKAREMGYQPSIAARTLRKSRTHIIGLVIGRVGGSLEKVEVIDRLAREAGYQAMISYTHGEPQTEAEVLRDMTGWNAAGILVITPAEGGDGSAIGEVMKRGIPVVTIGRPPGQPTCTVDADRLAAADIAGTHLLDLGRTKIALFYSGSSTSVRLLGLRQALQRAGRDPDDIQLFPGVDGMENGYACAREALRDGLTFDAVFAGNFTSGVGVMLAILDAGCRIPEDVAVVSQGETELAPFTPVPMTTVSLAEKEVLRAGFDMLLAQIRNPEDRAPRRILFEPILEVRYSTVPKSDLSEDRLKAAGNPVGGRD